MVYNNKTSNQYRRIITNQYRRKIKPEKTIRADELRKVIDIIEARLEYQRALSQNVYHPNDKEIIFWNRGFNTACNSLITLLEACILDYEGKL